jgi:hypothetical protein
MSNQSDGSTGGGIGFCGLLTITFIVLKLAKIIDWSWWWVLAPLWVPPVLLIIGAGISIVVAFSFFIYKEIKNK